MKDKVSELRRILHQQKANAGEVQDHTPPTDQTPDNEPQADVQQTPANANAQNGDQTLAELQVKYEEIQKANEIQKDMYLRKSAEFENFKKRLQKEHEELLKYTNEKLLEDIIPIIDHLEMTLTHVETPNDPIAEGVALTLKQFVSTLEKYGVTQISGQNENFDPHQQEAIGTQKVEGMEHGKVVTVHRKGYALNNRLIRPAMVTVSE